MRKFQLSKTTNSKWSKAQGQVEAVARIRAQLEAMGGPYRIREARVEPLDLFGPSRGIGPTMTRLKSIMKNGPVGSYWLVDTAKDVFLQIRIIEVDVIPDSSGTNPIDVVRYHLYHQFPQLSSYGICSCRRVTGTTSWSQHAYCNAEDYGASFSYMQKSVDWLNQNIGGRGEDLPISQLIFNRRIWEPDTGWQYYGGSDPHTGHFHISGLPERTGTPECAR